ncbi:MAG: B12-binding domain-containing radical SAM protein [Candidatus Woesearchaeota archaeon]
MNILVLNLPSKKKVIRRYNCSYHANGFYYPNQELLRAATILKKKHNVHYIDSQVNPEISDIKSITHFIDKNNISLVISMFSLEFINSDYEKIKNIKEKTDINVVGIGYILSLYPNRYPEVDIILDNFFEEKLYDSLSGKNLLEELRKNKDKQYKRNPDIIKRVDRSFINSKDYSELFSHGKTAFLYFGFGCPYKCNYCISAYNLNQYNLRNKEYIFNELRYLHKKNYKNVRILDDNFNINIDFLKDLNRFLMKNDFKFNFYALSRTDRLDKNLIDIYSQLNVKRLYVGLESLNESLLDYYNKNGDYLKLKENFSYLKNKNIEIGLWLLFNSLNETKNTFLSQIPRLRKLKPDFINLSILKPYPNTLFYKKNKSKINLDSNPENLTFKDKYVKIRNPALFELITLIKFYSHPIMFFKFLKMFFMYPITFFKLFFIFIKSIFKLDERNDLL